MFGVQLIAINLTPLFSGSTFIIQFCGFIILLTVTLILSLQRISISQNFPILVFLFGFIPRAVGLILWESVKGAWLQAQACSVCARAVGQKTVA